MAGKKEPLLINKKRGNKIAELNIKNMKALTFFSKLKKLKEFVKTYIKNISEAFIKSHLSEYELKKSINS